MQSDYGGPERELACDEALLEAAEAGELRMDGILRFWEGDAPFVVVGYANKVAQEVHASSDIPVFRRCTGGGSVLQGPGCLNYSLVLPINAAPELSGITQTNWFVMDRNRDALVPLLRGKLRVDGCTDLTLDGQKFSGNSQRRKNRWLLFHGTFLLKIDFELMDKVLRAPPREPAYRRGRSHSEFLATINLSADQVKGALTDAWDATLPFKNVPYARIEALFETKYSQREWNFRA